MTLSNLKRQDKTEIWAKYYLSIKTYKTIKNKINYKKKNNLKDLLLIIFSAKHEKKSGLIILKIQEI